MGLTISYGDLEYSSVRRRGTSSLSNADKQVRLEACQALGHRRDRSAVPALIRTYNSDSCSVVRHWAEAALIEVGDPRALPVILDHQRSGGPFRRMARSTAPYEAAISAAETDRDATLDFLLSTLHASSLSVRVQVRYALGEIGDRRAVGPLIDILKQDGPSSRRQSLMALVKIGDPAAIPTMEDAVRRVHLRSRRIKQGVRQFAAEATPSS